MLMGTSQRLNQVSSFAVAINNATLERVYKLKYLGVTLDPNLSWNEHIDVLGNKYAPQSPQSSTKRRLFNPVQRYGAALI